PAGHPASDESVPKFALMGTVTAAEFRGYRERFGLSAESLADLLGVALKTVQRWENGHRPIPWGVVEEMDILATAIRELAARPCAEHLLAAPEAVMMIPRAGTHLGFPASWYRALVDAIRDLLMLEYGDKGLTAATFRVVYFDEVEDQK
ncbi:MAG: helix-turn-helix domain-containing protein, partial [Aeromicrobium sp.]